ncbi:GMC family oxidoreductase [Desulfospira joergensenii]|uniref:GMC family oxidoreductase n=1 Tax=Desulfospira joergensenii TaxID=53329 RepID=UPI0003B73570|nr:GMC family oxidoreductase [Desulfospira joergensenii]
MTDFDFDYIVVGSGFGGSVSAMRLSQKGYRVGVIESGKRWKNQDFAKRNWNLHKFLWMPKIFLHGIQRMSLLNDVFILGGAGVGGGSLNYANTLYIPPDKFFDRDTVKRLGGKKELLPFYSIAKKMLGAVENPVLGESDHLMRETAQEFGRAHTFCKTEVGVYFGEEGKRARDPYFFGEGPDRIGCELCGACMTGCRKDAKNTLDKNYLFFAEKFGAQIIPENKVVDVRPLSPEGSAGYEITTVKTTTLFGKRSSFRTKGIVFSAGVLGTLSLLLNMKEKGRLPRLSSDLGKIVRTNSEAICGVKSDSGDADFSKGVAITSSVHPDEDTHMEPVRYAKGNDFMGLLPVLLTDGGGKIPRFVRYLFNVIKHPVRFFKVLNPIGFARRSLIILVMQTHDNYLNLFLKRRLIWPFARSLTSEQATDKKNPVYIPIANEFARRLGKRMGGTPTSIFTEVYLDVPITAHIMGGCCLHEEPGRGGIDKKNQVRGYENMLVADASTIPENLGVNPALSITALAERAMSFIPVKPSKKMNFLKAEFKWGIDSLLVRSPEPGPGREETSP